MLRPSILIYTKIFDIRARNGGGGKGRSKFTACFAQWIHLSSALSFRDRGYICFLCPRKSDHKVRSNFGFLTLIGYRSRSAPFTRCAPAGLREVLLRIMEDQAWVSKRRFPYEIHCLMGSTSPHFQGTFITCSFLQSVSFLCSYKLLWICVLKNYGKKSWKKVGKPVKWKNCS